MKRLIALASLLGLVLPEAARAGAMERALAKLDPEFRAHQVCILRGLDVLKREPRLHRADRLKTSIFSPAKVADTKLTAVGGAVRAKGHWYALTFSCDLTRDWMKATSFTYKLGAEIPERKWEDLGLWR